MRILTAVMATLASLTYSLGIAQAVSAPAHDHRAMVHLEPRSADRLDPIPAEAPIVVRHGDVSWLPAPDRTYLSTDEDLHPRTTIRPAHQPEGRQTAI